MCHYVSLSLHSVSLCLTGCMFHQTSTSGICNTPDGGGLRSCRKHGGEQQSLLVQLLSTELLAAIPVNQGAVDCYPFKELSYIEG